MANAPEYAPADYSTLEAVQHHHELQSKKDVEISNGVHGKERFSTLESAPNSPAPYSPDLNSKGNRYSTLEPYSPDHDHNEKPTSGLGLAPVAEASEEPKKGSWKRKRVCGVPLLFLVIGLVVLLAVVAAVVGGVVGSKKKSNDPEPTAQQSGESTTTGSSSPKASETSSGPKTTNTGLTGAAATWFQADEETVYAIRSPVGGYYLTDEGDDTVGLAKLENPLPEKFKFVLSAIDPWAQGVYDKSYPYPGAHTVGYRIRSLRGEDNKNDPLVLTLDVNKTVEHQPGNKETANSTYTPISAIPLRIGRNSTQGIAPSSTVWFFGAIDSTTYEDGNQIGWNIYNVAFLGMWALGVNDSDESNIFPELQRGKDGSLDKTANQKWILPKPDEQK